MAEVAPNLARFRPLTAMSLAAARGEVTALATAGTRQVRQHAFRN